MRVRLALLLFIPALSGCTHADHHKADTSTFGKRVECAELSASGKWENLPNGPFLDNTYYSPSLDTCVYAMKRSIRADKDGGLMHEYILVDALTRKQLWGNDPAAGEDEDQITTKMNDELKKLQITP
jgi:hypothetical protein